MVQEALRRSSAHRIRLDIQGLRAVAVLAVMVFHADKSWLPGGFIGVDVFFVISGFLITSIILEKKQNGSFSFGGFYWNRINRIVPAYAVMLAVTTVVTAVILTPGDFRFFKTSLNKASVFLSNVHFAESVNYFAPESHELALQHTWSLAIEMQFYLILPLFVIFLPVRWQRIFLPTAIVVLTAYTCHRLYVAGEQTRIYFFLLSRIPEFSIGACVALIGPVDRLAPAARNALGVAGGMLIAASLVLIDETTAFPGIAALFPCLGAAILIAVPNSAMGRPLSVPAMVWIGNLSYSLYLWHWPVLATLRYGKGGYALDATSLVLGALLTLGLSYCSYRWIEKPFQAGQSVRKIAVKYAAVLVVLASVALPSKTANRMIMPLPLNESYVDDGMCFTKMTDNCYRGDLQSDRSALLIGDSMAAHLNFFFDVVGKYNKFKVLSISAAGCLPIPGYDVSQAAESVRATCAAQAKAAAPFIEQSGMIVLAGNWSGHMQRSSFLESVAGLLEKAEARNQRVVVIAQPPSFKSDPVRAHRLSRLGLSSPVVEQATSWEEANRTMAAFLEKYPAARFVDFSHSDFFRDAPFHDGVLIYSDTAHFNGSGSYRFGDYVKDKLTKYLEPLDK